jgi:prepilin-type N-terminal cleavage/methylation domain-containing protein
LRPNVVKILIKLMQNQYKGFTILETIIVLLVAGIIALFVFLAVGQLQRSQRNTKVRAQVDKIATALYKQFSNSNLSTSFPAGGSTNLIKPANAWLDDTIDINQAPNGQDYLETFYRSAALNTTITNNVSAIHRISIAQFRSCSGSAIGSADLSRNVISILYYQEGAFGKTTGCKEVLL